jgi:hypothetical protein
MPITLRPYQEEVVNKVRVSLVKDKRVIFQAPTGMGKCFGEDTPILMYDGTIKKVQDVVVGDLLMGDDSCPRKVISTCTGKEKLYKIIPNKGTPFICNESHILALRYTDKAHNFQKVNIELKDYLKTNNYTKHLLKLYRSAVDFPKRDTGIDPYILGLWIAEGTKQDGTPQFTINNRETEIISYLLSIGAHKCNSQPNTNCVYISLCNHLVDPKPNIYRNEFRKCFFNDKYDVGIPDEYLKNDRDSRLSLLAGLLDGDGYTQTEEGGYEIVTKYQRLSEDILYLCRSLGFAAYSSIKTVDLSKIPKCKSKEVRDYYRISISGYCENVPVKSRFKKSPNQKINKNPLNTGFKIEPLEIGDYYGFEIKGNNRLFLLGDFTVVHNTVCFSYMAQQSQKFNRNVLIIAHRQEIVGQNGKTLENLGLGIEYVNPKKEHRQHLM